MRIMEDIYEYNFEKLNVWKVAIELAKDIYASTKEFPSSEIYGLTNQLRRAIVSVSSNIAEGSIRASRSDKKRFYDVAAGSLMETLSQLTLAKELGFIAEDIYLESRNKLGDVSRMLNSLIKSQTD